MWEEKGSHLLDTLRHDFHVSNEEDAEDFTLADPDRTLCSPSSSNTWNAEVQRVIMNSFVALCTM